MNVLGTLSERSVDVQRKYTAYLSRVCDQKPTETRLKKKKCICVISANKVYNMWPANCYFG